MQNPEITEASDRKRVERCYHFAEAQSFVGLKSAVTFNRYIQEGVIPAGHLVGSRRVWFESDIIIAQENIRQGLAAPSDEELEAKRRDYQERAQKQIKTRRQMSSGKSQVARS